MKKHARLTDASVAFGCFLFAFFMLNSANAYAQNQAKNGWFVGGSYLFKNVVNGDFNDTKVFYGEDEIDDIPDLEDGTGFAGFAGYRSGRTAIEMGYERAQMDKWSSLLGPGEANWNAINFDVKVHFLQKQRVQPFGLIGMTFPWLSIKDSEIYYTYDDAINLRDLSVAGGIGMNVGGGLAFYPSHRWRVSADILYRLGSFGKSGGDKVDERISFNGYASKVSLAYTF